MEDSNGDVCYTPCRDDSTEEICNTNSCPTLTTSRNAGNGGSGNTGNQNPPSTAQPVANVPQVPPAGGGDAEPTETAITETPSDSTSDIIEKILSSTMRHTRSVQYIGGRTQITERLKNIGMLDLADVSAVVEIPKTIAEKSSQIIQITDFTVLQDDPVIFFEAGNVESLDEAVIQYAFSTNITFDLAASIQVYVNYTTPSAEDVEKLKEQIAKTDEVLNLSRQINVDVLQNQTEYTLHVDFDDDTILHDVIIYEEIPKCLLELINEKLIESDRPYEIINEDPIIAWRFDTLIKGEEIRYAIKAIADEDCANQAKSLALARDIIVLKQGYNLWKALLGFLIVPIIVLFSLGMTRLGKSRPLLRRIEKVLIVFFVLGFNFLDLFGILPGDLLYISKMMGWVALGYVFYHLSLSRILFGTRRKRIDLIIVLSYFALVVKDVVQIARALAIESQVSHLLFDLYNFLILNGDVVQLVLFRVAIFGIGWSVPCIYRNNRS